MRVVPRGHDARYNKGGEWVDGLTSASTVDCRRTLGRNVADSVKKGDAVIVRGRARVATRERQEGQPSSEAWIVDASPSGSTLPGAPVSS